MHLTINRYQMDKSGTLSRVVVGDRQFYGIERPWINNKPEISCIPNGEYTLIHHDSEKYGPVWAFVGGSVSYQSNRHADRFACLIHSANYGHQVKGCLGLGKDKGVTSDGSLAVWSSRDAIRELRTIMPVDGDVVHSASILWFDQ
jgi:hypothetical protein